MSSANGSRAVDHDAPDRVTSFRGPRPSNDRTTTHGSRDAAHSATAAITSSNWATPIVSWARRSRRASAIAPHVRSDQRLSGGDRIEYRFRLVGRLGVLVRAVGGGHDPSTGLDIGGAVAHQRGADG